jgi:hypothetical protein
MKLILPGPGGVRVTVNPQSDAGRRSRPGPSSVGVYSVNFWPSFSVTEPFFRLVLEKAFGEFHRARSVEEADLVLTSVFPHVEAKYPEKTVALIWENLRPDYRFYARSLSFDFEDHGGRNQRFPLWYATVNWEGRTASGLDGRPEGAPCDIEQLMSPRLPPSEFASGFCCFVAGNDCPHRADAVRALSRITPVEVYGRVGGRPIASKFELLPSYRFNLCFENSGAPGYHTEKPTEAWMGGCIPLYWSDASYSRDFNPRAMINLVDFESLEAFVDYVAEVNASPARLAEIYSQPLLTTAPSLAPAAAFLREAVER